MGDFTLNDNQLALFKQFVGEEGYKTKLYKDSVGKWTIGVGRNLDDVGLSDDEIKYLWLNDIRRAEQELDEHLPWWRNLDEIRQRVIIDLCFNMGIGNLLGFKNTLAAVQRGDYEAASKGLLQSLWAHQVDKDLTDTKGRANVLAEMLRNGKD